MSVDIKLMLISIILFWSAIGIAAMFGESLKHLPEIVLLLMVVVLVASPLVCVGALVHFIWSI